MAACWKAGFAIASKHPRHYDVRVDDFAIANKLEFICVHGQGTTRGSISALNLMSSPVTADPGLSPRPMVREYEQYVQTTGPTSPDG